MTAFRARGITRVLRRRSCHHHRTILAHEVNSFNEPLLSGELSDGRWSNPHLEEIPQGFLPIYVGPDQRRFIIPMAYLSMPDFMVLMEKAADEFGFEQEGGLKILCEERAFEEILFKCLAKHRYKLRTRISKKIRSLVVQKSTR